MDWAVGKKKPFFVGSRSLALRNGQPMKRRLVGFTLPLAAPVLVRPRPEPRCP